MKNQSISLRKILSFVITVLGIVYLILVLSGKVNKDKLGQTEVVIFTAILIFNSELIDKLAKVQLSKDGMTLEMEKVKQEQANQRVEIESIVAFLVKRVMEDSDYKLLQDVAKDTPIKYDKVNNPKLESGLDCLCKLGLIEQSSGEPLNLEKLPSPTEHLQKYIRPSERGRQCLQLIKKYK